VTATLDLWRFRHEIETAARLQHPHICTVYDSGETDSQLWFTMPYVALHEDLIWALSDDQLRAITRLTPDDVDGGRADWRLALAEAHHFLGDTVRSRA